MKYPIEFYLTKYGVFLAGAFISFTVTLLLLPAVIRFAEKRGLVDKPNARKLHQRPVSRLGGTAVVTGMALSFGILQSVVPGHGLGALLPAFAVIFITGLWDDLKELRAGKKLALQTVGALLLVGAGIRLELFSATEFHFEAIEWGLSLILILFLTNAFNLIDGVDGLAALLGITSFSALALLLVLRGEFGLALLLSGATGALFSFLLYNKSPAMIFMGDLGSLGCGFLLSIAVIKLVSIAPGDPSPSYPPALPMLAVAVPAFDALRVLATRFFRGQSPFKADKTHVHHILVGNGFQHPDTTLLIFCLHLFMIFLGISGFALNPYVLSALAVVSFGAGIVFFEGLGFFKFLRRSRKVKAALKASKSKNPFSLS